MLSPEEFKQRKREESKKWYHSNIIKERKKRRDRYHKNISQYKIIAKNYVRETKLKVIEYYSDGRMECVCCHEKHLEFLSIDHINGDGGAQRRIGLRSYNLWRWLIKNNFPLGFQILCHNCNQAKGQRGKCPHEIEREQHKIQLIKEEEKKGYW